MDAINFTTATAVDLIERSLVMHPRTFEDALWAAQRSHADYAKANPLSQGQEGAVQAANACGTVANLLWINATERKIAEEIVRKGPSEIAQAVTIAGKLQCVPPYIRAEIAGRPGV